ncbi:MAG: DUF1501 domain-containing protein [Planctomycetia bacterium]|nr:DUF1501 domain-containing protein [Planctomycetia bacterium]
MISLGTVTGRDCQGIHRRDFLRLGTAGFAGLNLAGLLRSAETASSHRPARSCIFIYLAGGPSHLETFDPKPAAPLNVRGPWGAIPTAVPGTHFGEMLPELARQANRFAVLRSLNHTNALHQPWPMMTGNMPHRVSHGAAVTYLNRDTQSSMPPHVHLGPRLSVGGGGLGRSAEALEIADPLAVAGALDEFTLAQNVNADRLEDREELLSNIDDLRRMADGSAAVRAHDAAYRRALGMLTSSHVRDAFDLARESESLRDRYGANCFGQSCLLARRLVEAGTRFVQIVWYNREDGFAVGWDVHGDDLAGLVRMEQQLCPRFDQGLSALLADLGDRGLLDSTLVCAAGEFGRAPHISKLGGRDHWPYCFSALLAGAGVPGGTVVGASDARGAYPADRPASPADFAATLYHILGVDPAADDRLRPATFEGRPIGELCGV